MIFLFSSLSISQKSSQILLPLGNKTNNLSEQHFKDKTEILVEEDRTITIENKKFLTTKGLNLEIEKLFTKHLDTLGLFDSKIVISADKRVSYSYVDSIKEEISLTFKKLIYYSKKQSYEKEQICYEVERNLSKRYFKNPYGPNIPKQEFSRVKLVKIHGPEWITNIENAFSHDIAKRFNEAVYLKDSCLIKNLQKEIAFSLVRILPQNFYSINGIKSDIKNLDKLAETLDSGNLVLIQFHPDLIYQDYINYLENKSKLFLLVKDKDSYKYRMTELSKVMERNLSEMNFEIK